MIENLRKKDIYRVFVLLYVLFTFSVGIISSNIIPGIHIYTNKSGSMDPIINTGSLIVVRKQAIYEVGDVVSYNALAEGKGIIISHRIVGIGGNVYLTKGDANTAVDRETVVPRLIIGKVVLVIPYLGYIVSVVKSTLGVLFTILLPASAIILVELTSIIKALR
jgi:signal peptidase